MAKLILNYCGVLVAFFMYGKLLKNSWYFIILLLTISDALQLLLLILQRRRFFSTIEVNCL